MGLDGRRLGMGVLAELFVILKYALQLLAYPVVTFGADVPGRTVSLLDFSGKADVPCRRSGFVETCSGGVHRFTLSACRWTIRMK